MEFLLQHSGAADKAVRFRCCQLLGSLTTEYTQRPDVADDDLECFVDKLLPRLRDKVCAVAASVPPSAARTSLLCLLFGPGPPPRSGGCTSSVFC